MKATRFPVLMYHRIAPRCGGDPWCLSPRRFRAQMQGLARAGYRAAPLDLFLDWMRGEADPGPGRFLLTFDDGYQGVLDHGIPILEALGWPATLFLVAGRLGLGSDWERRGGGHRLLDEAGVRELVRRGFSVQSHGFTHADLNALADDARLEHELTASRQRLEALTGSAVRTIAYPYGRTDGRVQSAAREAGYEWAFGVRSGFNRPGVDPMDLRRLDIRAGDGPRRLRRKVRFGTNDGRLRTSLQYYIQRIQQRFMST